MKGKEERARITAYLREPTDLRRVEKVSRQMIRDIKTGEKVRFILPDIRAVESARAAITFITRYQGERLVYQTDGVNRWLTIARPDESFDKQAPQHTQQWNKRSSSQPLTCKRSSRTP